MVTGEGRPWLILVGLLGVAAYQYAGPLWALPFAFACVWLFLLFRDPARTVPPEPRAVVAPIDGRIIDVGPDHQGQLPGRWLRITIKTNHFGAYAVRSPIEGSINSVGEKAGIGPGAPAPVGMWLCSEEQDNVVLLFPGGNRWLRPKAFVRYGERVGQGQRFAYLRLAPRAVVYLETSATVRVAPGDYVLAGETILAELAPMRA